MSQVFSFPLRWVRMARVGWSWAFPFFQLRQALIIPQQVRAIVNQFLLRAGLVEKNRILWHMLKLFLFPFPPGNTGAPQYLLKKNLVNPLEINVAKLWRSYYDWDPVKLLNLRLIHTVPLSGCMQGFLPWHTGSCSDFHSIILVPLGHDSLYSSISNLRDISLRCVLTSFMCPHFNSC